MNKKLILPISLIILIGLVGVVVALIDTEYQQQVNLNDQFGTIKYNEVVTRGISEVSLNLKQGWNLLPLEFIGDAAGRYWAFNREGKTTCNQDIFYNVWYYSPELNDYYHVPIANDSEGQINIRDWQSPKSRGNTFLTNEFQKKYYHIFYGSAWIYSEEDCALTTSMDVDFFTISGGKDGIDFTYDELTLKKGWNLIPVGGMMSVVGLSFAEIFRGCDVQKVNAWDNEHQKWLASEKEMTDFLSNFNKEVPNLERIFSTIAIKTGTDCKPMKNIYSISRGIGGGATGNCRDSDGGKNYALKGTVSAPDEAGTDECCTSTSSGGYECTGNGKFLHEWYCDINTLGEDQFYECPNGCSNGACIN